MMMRIDDRHAPCGPRFRRGLDTRTIFVFRCPVTQVIYYIGHDPVPAVVEDC
jgi:hypothetical protein